MTSPDTSPDDNCARCFRHELRNVQGFDQFSPPERFQHLAVQAQLDGTPFQLAWLLRGGGPGPTAAAPTSSRLRATTPPRSQIGHNPTRTGQLGPAANQRTRVLAAGPA